MELDIEGNNLVSNQLVRQRKKDDSFYNVSFENNNNKKKENEEKQKSKSSNTQSFFSQWKENEFYKILFLREEDFEDSIYENARILKQKKRHYFRMIKVFLFLIFLFFILFFLYIINDQKYRFGFEDRKVQILEFDFKNQRYITKIERSNWIAYFGENKKCLPISNYEKESVGGDGDNYYNLFENSSFVQKTTWKNLFFMMNRFIENQKLAFAVPNMFLNLSGLDYKPPCICMIKTDEDTTRVWMNIEIISNSFTEKENKYQITSTIIKSDNKPRLVVFPTHARIQFLNESGQLEERQVREKELVQAYLCLSYLNEEDKL
jgi:hypothetical protein